MPRREAPLRPLTVAERGLVVQHLRLAYFWAGKLSGKTRRPVDDLMSDCFWALCRTAQTWQPDRCKFGTWYKWQVLAVLKSHRLASRPQAFRHLTRHPSYPQTFSLETFTDDPPDPWDDVALVDLVDELEVRDRD